VADELRIGLSELLRKAMIEQDADFLKEGVRVLSQALMEMEVQEHVGAARHERGAGRTGQRNGYRQRSWDTRVGTVELKVPGSATRATSPHCWSRVGKPREHWQRLFRKPTSMVSPPARWMSWLRLWGWVASPRALCLRTLRGTGRGGRAFP
jgi:Transposase, Mutator family